MELPQPTHKNYTTLIRPGWLEAVFGLCAERTQNKFTPERLADT